MPGWSGAGGIEELLKEPGEVWQHGQRVAGPGQGLHPLGECQVSLQSLWVQFGVQVSACGALHTSLKYWKCFTSAGQHSSARLPSPTHPPRSWVPTTPLQQ